MPNATIRAQILMLIFIVLSYVRLPGLITVCYAAFRHPVEEPFTSPHLQPIEIENGSFMSFRNDLLTDRSRLSSIYRNIGVNLDLLAARKVSPFESSKAPLK